MKAILLEADWDPRPGYPITELETRTRKATMASQVWRHPRYSVGAAEDPSPGHGEVVVRVRTCGVCGSDLLRIFTKGTYSFPTICGHEFAGTVEELGPGVEGVAVGDRVAVFPLLWCGECPACEQGRYVQCHDYDYLGSRCDGGFVRTHARQRDGS